MNWKNIKTLVITMETIKRLNKLEANQEALKKKMDQIEQAIVSGNLDGTMIDSLNFLIQMIKKYEAGIKQFRGQVQNQTQELQKGVVIMNKFIKDTGQSEAFEKFFKEEDEKMAKMANEVMKQKMAKEPITPTEAFPKVNQDDRKENQEAKQDSTDNKDGPKSGSDQATK